MNRVAVLVYLVVTMACVLLALALTDAGPVQPGHPQPGNPAWPDAPSTH